MVGIKNTRILGTTLLFALSILTLYFSITPLWFFVEGFGTLMHVLLHGSPHLSNYVVVATYLFGPFGLVASVLGIFGAISSLKQKRFPLLIWGALAIFSVSLAKALLTIFLLLGQGIPWNFWLDWRAPYFLTTIIMFISALCVFIVWKSKSDFKEV